MVSCAVFGDALLPILVVIPQGFGLALALGFGDVGTPSRALTGHLPHGFGPGGIGLILLAPRFPSP